MGNSGLQEPNVLAKACAWTVVLAALGCAVWARSAPAAEALPGGVEVTLKGSLVCNGACIADPKPDDHLLVLYAIDGTPEVRAEVEKIMAKFYPDKGLDADAAQELMDQFTARLKYYIPRDSPALKDDKNRPPNHYCMPATASAVTGVVALKDGKRWLTAARIEPAHLKYPDRMLAPDVPFVRPGREPLILRITDRLTLKCVCIPPGKFLMGTPFYMWPYFVEEYPHAVTLTRPFYMAEIPVTQEIYQAVMGVNPSTVKDPQLPVQDPRFADIEEFCKRLSEKNSRKVRLPTDAEWEYVARVGTSNPGFQEKYKDQFSGGDGGFKAPLTVKSRQPNAWGLYDMPSCWWEITGDRGMYNARQSETDPYYPPPAGDAAQGQRSGRGILQPQWSIGTHEFITEKGYAGQKFRVVVEAEPAASPR